MVSNPLLVCRTWVSLAQEIHTLVGKVDDDDVLVRVCFLLPAVVEGLFFRVFGPLASSLGGVDDEPVTILRGGLALGKLAGIPFRQDTQIIEGHLEDGQQAVEPVIHPLLTQGEKFSHDDLKRINFEVDQQEQQLLFREVKNTVPTSASSSLPGSASQSAIPGIQPVIGTTKGFQQTLEFLQGQTRKSEKSPPLVPKF